MNLKKIPTTLVVSSLALAGVGVTADDNMRDATDSATKSMESATETMDSSTNSSTTGTTSADTAADSNTPVVLLVPMVFAANDTLADGCWARLYDEENYRGNLLALTGPMELSNTDPHKTTGYEIGRNYDSVAVGPKATLMVYDNVGFADKSATFKGGQRVPDLDPKMGYFEEIQSMKVTCSTDDTAMTE
jgi:hypothetical protein